MWPQMSPLRALQPIPLADAIAHTQPTSQELRQLQYHVFMDTALDEINPDHINRSRNVPINFNGSTSSSPVSALGAFNAQSLTHS